MSMRSNIKRPENLRSGGPARRFAEKDKRTKRVLLVDDHNIFRQFLAVVLEQHTHFKENLQAGSPAEARRLTDRPGCTIDLAIIDLDLPDGGGPELIRDLRRVTPGVRVLALTARGGPEVRTLALQAGADEVLTMMATGEEIVGAAQRLGGG